MNSALCSALVVFPAVSSLRCVADAILGKSSSFPGTDGPRLRSSIVSFEAVAETGGHVQEAPRYVYGLEGTLDARSRHRSEKCTPTGWASHREGLATTHTGHNVTSSLARVLVVNRRSLGLHHTVLTH